ncbi:uncharacterized protein LOC126234711 [Schistocerca nitens]|uniref:uncharacterized protein LOC126234711 n=1 Tax=Schistocerca nitens TaxID=7011 RepID=UPI00211928A7|nr:uncharacterized protein LOC126234711 [Schistocerca nitens]
MQKAFIFVVVVVACVGASFAQVTCSDHCLDLAEKANYARDPYSYQDLIDEFHGDGCDDSCLLYQAAANTERWRQRRAPRDGGRRSGEHQETATAAAAAAAEEAATRWRQQKRKRRAPTDGDQAAAAAAAAAASTGRWRTDGSGAAAASAGAAAAASSDGVQTATTRQTRLGLFHVEDTP